MYALGMPVTRRRSATFLFGTGVDAIELSRHVAAHVGCQTPPDLAANAVPPVVPADVT